MKLLDLYKSILATCNLRVSNDGYVSLVMGDDTKPAMIKDKRLVLPTPEHLAKPSKDKIIFHPLTENQLRNESDVLEFLRNTMNIRIGYTFGALGYQLLTLATSHGNHAKLSPDQSEFLSIVKNADEKTLQVFTKLLAAAGVGQSQKSLVSIYLKRSGSVNGKKHTRAGIVTFPLYNELIKSPSECYGVKLRVKDYETIKNLMEYMLPGIATPEFYNRGSDCQVAPFLDALMKVVLAVASPLNDLVELFKDYIEDAESLQFESDWVETFENLEVMLPEIRKVPMQAGNEGAVGEKSSTAQQQALTVPAAPLAPPVPQQPVWMGQPQPQQPLPFVPQHIPPAIVNTGRGLDFGSVIAATPALAMQVGGMGSPQQYGQTLGSRPPRWDNGMPAPMQYIQQPQMNPYQNQMPAMGYRTMI